MKALVVHGMHGMGDSLYQRAVIKQVGPVFLHTPWPQLYADIPNVTCLSTGTRLRTQAKNEGRSKFATAPKLTQQVRWHYRQTSQSILDSLAEGIGLTHPAPYDMRGPVFESPVKGPYIVVRPVCLRKEWTSDSRNPKPEYIAAAIEHLRKDFTIVSVADLQEGQEWALEPLPYADVTYHRGELSIEQLLGLARCAAGLVGGVGWIVPAALSYQVPLLLIYGGWGYSNGPHRLFGVPHDFIDQVLPDAFCMCQSNRHECDKRIAGFDDRARAFALRLVRGTALAA